MKLVFATNNLNKLKEVQEILSNSIEILSLKDSVTAERTKNSPPTTSKIKPKKRNKIDIHYFFAKISVFFF
jgi:XTP/dITP diphosphohydrolase